MIPFLLTAIAIEFTPGPNMVYLALLSAQRGRIAGLCAVAGVASGLALLGALAGLGLAGLVAENRLVWEGLRWAGAAYLCWLAFDTFQDSRRPLAVQDITQSLWVFFRQGVITNLLNPKALMFYVTVLPAFVDHSQPIPSQTIAFTCVYVMVATLIHLVIVLAAGSFTRWFDAPKVRARAGLVFALLLLGVAIWLLAKTGWPG